MEKKPFWWAFLRIGDDGWSGGFRSVDMHLKHLGRKSRSIASRNNYCYLLSRLCKKAGMNPDELILKAREDPDFVASIVQEFADEYQTRGSTRYANNVIHLSRSFFKVNKVDLDLHGYYQPTRSRKRPEYIPSLVEASKIADVAGSLRDRLIILILIYTGLRNSTLRALIYNEAYPDPLLQEYTIKKQLERGEECLAIIVHEVMKRRVANACKNRVFYYTFIPPKVAECLRLYLQDRERKYGNILDSEPIFITENRKLSLSERRKTPISARELQQIIKNAARKSGIKNWEHVYPHCLRKTYESLLRNQPDDVKLDEKEREFLFGHTLPGSQDAYFDKSKIEELRVKYAKMIFEPIAGIEKEERMVSEDELQTFLQQGWHFEATLPSGKVVVSRKAVMKQPTEVKAAGKTQIPSNTTFEKENPSAFSKSLGQGISPSVSFLTSQHQPLQHNIGKEYEKISRKESEQRGLKRWVNLPQAELSPTPSPTTAKATVEKREQTVESTSENKISETKQRSVCEKYKAKIKGPLDKYI
jgi:integrase